MLALLQGAVGYFVSPGTALSARTCVSYVRGKYMEA
jgi:hypothetical protein